MGASSSSSCWHRRTRANSDPLNGTSDFGYEEFDGHDGKTCPTCQGTGRISKRQSEELVALIPYNDKRLKPRRTTRYVAVAIILCLIACGLILFFIIPRSVKISEGGICNYTVNLDQNYSTTEIRIINQFNITNTNFFRIEVTEIEVEAFFDQVSVGKGTLKGTPLEIPPKTKGFPANVTVDMTFNEENKLQFVYGICSGKLKGAHDILIMLHVTMTSAYLSHSEQDTLAPYKYVNCAVSHKNHKNQCQ